MTDRLLEDVNELIRLGHGDQDRLAHIKKSLENDKSLFKSDLDYVTNLITQHLSQHPPPESSLIQKNRMLHQENPEQAMQAGQESPSAPSFC